MIIVSGHLRVHPDDREGFLVECRTLMEMARASEGCADFHMSADLIETDRVNIVERWLSREQLDEFRGGGTPDDQTTRITDASVSEYYYDREVAL